MLALVPGCNLVGLAVVVVRVDAVPRYHLPRFVAPPGDVLLLDVRLVGRAPLGRVRRRPELEEGLHGRWEPPAADLGVDVQRGVGALDGDWDSPGAVPTTAASACAQTASPEGLEAAPTSSHDLPR